MLFKELVECIRKRKCKLRKTGGSKYKLKFKEVNKLNMVWFLFLVKVRHITNVRCSATVAFAPLRYLTDGALQKVFLCILRAYILAADPFWGTRM